MLAQETIRRKRDGFAISRAETESFVKGFVEGEVSAEQASAFAMAIFWRGMTAAETADLTRAMAHSGTMLDWTGTLPGPVLDKHSTGGVGDNVSLVLAPLLAACGACVPMIAGRGLGHTGGTLDKLDAVPGYRTQPGLDEFRRVVRTAGCAIIGQTDDLAPADKRLYAIRDVTGTVESVPLITASILAKKLAAGLGGLVMDVKVGSGAFMATPEQAHTLARSIVDTATAAGLPTVALMTNMDAPLARHAGNAVEVLHAVEHLTGARREPRFLDVTLALAAEMLVLGKLARDTDDGRAIAERALAGGHAAERFAKMCAALGGPADFVDRPKAYLARAPVTREVFAHTPGEVFAHGCGNVTAIDTRALGLAVIALGGGRRLVSDRIDHAVGLVDLAGIGDSADLPLAVIHARDEAAADAAALAAQAAYRFGVVAPVPKPLVLGRVTAE